VFVKEKHILNIKWVLSPLLSSLTLCGEPPAISYLNDFAAVFEPVQDDRDAVWVLPKLLCQLHSTEGVCCQRI
jgi:hypothetical protein